MIFPSLPTYRAQWAPVYFETIPGSGERFTCAIIAAGEDQSREIRDALRPYALREMFGDQGSALHGMLIQQVMVIDDFLKNGGDWTNPPIIMSNIHVGAIRTTLAEDFNQVFNQAIRLCACLGESTLGMNSIETHDVDEPLRDWARQIKAEVGSIQKNLIDSFGLPITTNDPKRPTAKIGFLYHDYAASFGVLHARPDRISQDISNIKRRMWDLMQLRYNQLHHPRRMEVVVGHPSFKQIQHNQKLTSALLFRLDRIKEEARNAQISVFPTDDAKEAAEHILLQVA